MQHINAKTACYMLHKDLLTILQNIIIMAVIVVISPRKSIFAPKDILTSLTKCNKTSYYNYTH